MTNPAHKVLLNRDLRRAGFALLLMCALAMYIMPSAQAQTYTVLHNFQGQNSGIYPTSGVSIDRGGNLYGTTQYGGPGMNCYEGCGIVFKMSRHGSSWLFTPIYNFQGGLDGGNPGARPVIGPNGSLFGTTTQGGTGCLGMGCGTAYNLQPPPHASANVLGQWLETVLYRFQGGNDGASPEDADLAFDAAGNIYGTTLFGGQDIYYCQDGCGTVYELSRVNGNWTESILHAFFQTGDAMQPWGGVIFDQGGNLYGTTNGGGANRDGVVYQLIHSGSSWTENILYNFTGGSDGEGPYAGLMMDQQGNLYGTTCCGATNLNGSVFELTRSPDWAFSTLHAFGGPDGQEPLGTVVMDAAGNLYGTTSAGGANGWGTIFKLSPGSGGWTFTSLYDFCPGGYPCTDGAGPSGTLAIDAAGNLYGTTMNGGATGGGVVFEFAP